jgi:hypothetical protein
MRKVRSDGEPVLEIVLPPRIAAAVDLRQKRTAHSTDRIVRAALARYL